MPLKEAAGPLLDEVDAAAHALGSVNTVGVRADGRLAGTSTDAVGVGVAAGLRRLGVAPGAPVLVLGAGGTARAAVGEAAGAGRELRVAARRPEAVAALVEVGERLGVRVADAGRDLAAAVHGSGAAAVVSTLPVAGAQAVVHGLGPAGWPAGLPLLDVLYAPDPPPLAALATRAGERVTDGLVVLAGQAAEQVRLWSGATVDAARLEEAGRRARG